MTLITIQIDPQDYFQEGKKKITEGFKCLHDLVRLCKHSLSPENGGILHETMTYLQSLPRRIQEIECVAQQGGAAPPSFNVHGTDLQHGQTTVIESVAPQGDAFVSNPHVNDQRINPSEDMERQLTNWLNERVSLPVIGNYEADRFVFSDFKLEVENMTWSSNIMSEVRKLKDYCMTSSNKYKFDLAVKQVESMGKKVTSKCDDVRCLYGFQLLDWAMGYKEVFCELKRIDPDFTSSNFDWDDATSLHSFWVLLEDIENHILGDSKSANECFPMIYHFFSKMLQFKNTENQYFRLAALRCREIFDEYCNNFKLVSVITVILDPRFKLDTVKHFYNAVYDNEGDLHFKKIMDDVTNIYNEYARDVNNSSMVIAYANEAFSSKSELDRYLTVDKVPPHEGFDILKWWGMNSPTYPTLAMMARDFLSVPIVYSFDDVCFEDGFADIYNSDLDDDLKYAMTCTKVWLNDRDCM